MLAQLRPHHLQRQPSGYLRQSTPGPVDSHRERTERQDALGDRAVDLGWDRGHVVLRDQDRGPRGPTPQGRDDFHRLRAAVGLGEVGAVFAREASRFSRAHADWHRLLDLCALPATLGVAQAGVYAPHDGHDRVLLGCQGPWSHTALHALRLRRQGATRHQAPTGELRCHPAPGSLYDPAGALLLAPDERVVASLHLRFQPCKPRGSAPAMRRSKPHANAMRWSPRTAWWRAPWSVAGTSSCRRWRHSNRPRPRPASMHAQTAGTPRAPWRCSSGSPLRQCITGGHMGLIPAIPESPGGPWWHTVTPAVLATLRQHIRRVPLHTDTLGIPKAH